MTVDVGRDNCRTTLAAGGGRSASLLGRLRGKFSAGDWLPVVRRLPHPDGRVGLSFDDGPAAEATPVLLEVLRRYDSTATFFVIGERAAAAMGAIEQVVAAGHDVFPHGWRHIRYASVSSDVLIDDLDRTESLLSRLRSRPSPYLVRLPYGSGHTTPRVHRALRRWNPATQIAHWDHLTYDWTLAEGCDNPIDLRRACAAAAARISAAPALIGSILLLHEKPFDVSAPLASQIAPTLAALLLEGLRARGLRGARMVPMASPARIHRYIRG
jgi:peptidoglycan/xylan/chitin deacetylase (PgdA/CDA1 family)